MIEPIKCDFCSLPDVHWRFPARDLEFKEEHAESLVQHPDSSLSIRAMDVSSASVGDWAACNECHALIVRGDRDRLAQRSTERFLEDNPDAPIPFDNLRNVLRRRHDAFWENRLGAPVPYNPTPHRIQRFPER